MLRHWIGISSLLLGLLVAARPAVAGPPLLCHPFDIGAAKSLPWNGSQGWWGDQRDYDVRNLTADTQALLTPATPVIVRMETLRRAAIYASRDEAVARQLMAALTARTGHADANALPLALFDAGYFTETVKQIADLGGMMSEYRANARVARAALEGASDGYALLSRSLALKPNDPAIEFAAALVTRGTRKATFEQHASKARQGVQQDALLAKNIKQLSE